MSDVLQTALSIVGAIGGIVGVWAAVATVHRDRPRITLEVGFCKASNPISEPIQVELPSKEPSSYYLTVKIRNIGYRPVFLEEIVVEYPDSPESGSRYQLTFACEVVLEETRRSHTVYLGLSHAPDQRPVRLSVIDNRGTNHIVELKASRLAISVHRRASKLFGRWISHRLAAAHSLNSFFADDNRDPFRTETRTME